MADYDLAQKNNAYGLGFRQTDYEGHHLIGHRGAVRGSRSFLLFDPEGAVRRGDAVEFDDGEATGLGLEVFDLYYRRPFHDWLRWAHPDGQRHRLRSQPYGQQAPLSRRAAGLALTLVANLLLILMLLSLAPFAPRGPPAGRSPVLIDLPAGAEPSPGAHGRPAQGGCRAEPPEDGRARTAAAPRAGSRPLEYHDGHQGGVRRIRHLETAAAPPRSVGRRRRTVPGQRQHRRRWRDPDRAERERLFNAQWYVEPTQAELAYYVPANAPRPAVALIACRTVARFRVEDCVPLGETPTGSGWRGRSSTPPGSSRFARQGERPVDVGRMGTDPDRLLARKDQIAL